MIISFQISCWIIRKKVSLGNGKEMDDGGVDVNSSH